MCYGKRQWRVTVCDCSVTGFTVLMLFAQKGFSGCLNPIAVISQTNSLFSRRRTPVCPQAFRPLTSPKPPLYIPIFHMNKYDPEFRPPKVTNTPRRGLVEYNRRQTKQENPEMIRLAEAGGRQFLSASFSSCPTFPGPSFCGSGEQPRQATPVEEA